MKQRPILCSAPVVESLLAGRKTQTRRLKNLDKINNNSDEFRYDGIDEVDKTIHWFEKIHLGNETEKYTDIKCPYGKIGDELWVRESWAKYAVLGSQTEQFNFFYKASETKKLDWKPSLFMPKEACRIFLKISDIRVEKLGAISEKDAIAEGIEVYLSENTLFGEVEHFKDYEKNKWIKSPHLSYVTLWNSIHGTDAWAEDREKYVWVVSFERIEKS